MEQNAIPLNKLGIPPELARYVDAATPREVRLMAARGLLPAPPRVLIAIQYCLVADPDPEVAQASHDALMTLPANLVEGAVDDNTHPKILEFFAFNRVHDERLIEHVLLRRQVNDRTLSYLAEVTGPRLLDLIAANQQRLLISPSIYLHIKKNPSATKATLDRVESFLRIHHALEELEAEAEPVSGPDSGQAPVDLSAGGDAQEFEYGFEDEDEDWPDEFIEEGRTGSEEQKHDLWAMIAGMSTGKKIKLAFFGNATVRGILVRDTNKVVASAVMKSPRITDTEVIAIAKNRNVCDDVLREISRNKEWFKSYAVKLALVNNPKTPTAISVPIVNQLMLHDLKSLASNRNVSSVVTTTARQTLRRKAPK